MSYRRNISVAAYIAATLVQAAGAGEDREAFFEARIRPVLVEHCYACHNSIDLAEGELALDWRNSLMKGGATGPSVVPGKPEGSLLLKMIRHEIDGQEMPSGGPKLSEATIADFERWIRDGAIDPRTNRPTAQSTAAETSWEAKFERRKRWWSLQPITDPVVPASTEWSDHTIDRFLEDAWSENGLLPVADADAATVLRRLHTILIGLPADVHERVAFESDFAKGATSAIEHKINELMAEPSFGERWARHWMDCVRYSEGSGGQGDPRIVNAFEYRDYLIRALNADVPFDQLVREHIAGDLLPNPRIDQETGIRESMIGLAHFRFVEHGYFPVDALDELVKFTDNQIDVVSKSFLGLTVSCARCHDHKFDAISQRDYYALFGLFASSRPAHRLLVSSEPVDAQRETLEALRQSFAVALKQHWLDEVNREAVRERLETWSNRRQQEKVLIDANPKSQVKFSRIAPTDLMYAWDTWQNDTEVAGLWLSHRERIENLRSDAKAHNASITDKLWSFREGLPDGWQVADGTVRVHRAGELGMATNDDDAILSLLPAGISTHSATTFEQASIASPDFTIPNGAFSANWAGAGAAMLRLVPENYPQPGGGLYKQVEAVIDGQAHWFGQETDFWQGRRGYFQLMTRDTATAKPPGSAPKATDKKPSLDSRGSWFSLSEIRLLKNEKDRARDELFPIEVLLAHDAPHNRIDLLYAYVDSIKDVLERFQTDQFTDEDALFLSHCFDAELLAHTLSDFDDEAKEILLRIRRIENAFPALNRSTPAIMDTVGFDQLLLIRGDHRKPEKPVERGFLTAFSSGGKELATSSTDKRKPYSRLQLADDLTMRDNPLVRRVIVNRLWQRVFGRGIVATTDNFGATGEMPTHPELLDYLATQFERDGWSIKSLLRTMLTSRAFRLASTPTAIAKISDPTNRWRTHADVRRLDAEIIRDSLLTVSGELDIRMFGPSVPVPVAVEKDKRRGIYVAIDRSDQHELFAAFDVPFPTTTRGTRDVTTTPAQSITLLNSPFVWHQARAWAQRSLSEQADVSDRDRLFGLIQHALARAATDEELERLELFLDESRTGHDNTQALTSVAHLIFNLKEFIYVP